MNAYFPIYSSSFELSASFAVAAAVAFAAIDTLTTTKLNLAVNCERLKAARSRVTTHTHENPVTRRSRVRLIPPTMACYSQPATYELESTNESYLHDANYLNVVHDPDKPNDYDHHLDTYPTSMEMRKCMHHSTCRRLIMYTAYISSPIYEGFDVHELQSTQMSDEIGYYDVEDDRQWLKPTETNYPFKYSSAENSRNTMLLPTTMTCHRNSGQDFRSTPTILDNHTSIIAQTYGANAQEQMGSSFGSKPRNVHGIRLRPISDLRL
jgi:hypothetical protein